MSNWKDVWERKGNVEKNEYELKDLIAIDGYDGAGFISESSWVAMVETIEKKLALAKDEAICEIGCGAGASFYPLYRKGFRHLSGIDYSSSLVAIAKRVMPEGDFRIAEACKVPFASNQFDAVISTGIFHYFKSLDYAESAVREIVRILKPGMRAAVLDINDLKTKAECEAARRGKLGPEEYDRLYRDYPHLFYEREWFESIAEKLGVKCEIADQSIPGYVNAKFRFNFFLRKPQEH